MDLSDDGHNCRPSLSVPSTKTQTLLAKALCELSTNSVTIAAVAASSEQIVNSSLSANIATNVAITRDTIPLFLTVFSPARSLPLQFVPEITFVVAPLDSEEIFEVFASLARTKYFSRSLTSLRLIQPHPNFISDLIEKALENFGVEKSAENPLVLARLDKLFVEGHISEDDITEMSEKSTSLLNNLSSVDLWPLTGFIGNEPSRNLSCIIHSRWGGKVKSLWVGGAKISDDDLSDIDGLGNVVELKLACHPERLYRSTFGDLTLNKIATLRRLEKLDLSYCSEITSNGVLGLLSLPLLQELNLKGCDQLTDDALKYLAWSSPTIPPFGLKNLRILNLAESGVEISDTGLRHLTSPSSAISKLETLILDDLNSITNESLKLIASPSNKWSTTLKRLSLQSCFGITSPEGMVELAENLKSSLIFLDFSNCHNILGFNSFVTEEQSIGYAKSLVESLAKMEKLEQIDFAGCGLAKEEVDFFDRNNRSEISSTKR